MVNIALLAALTATIQHAHPSSFSKIEEKANLAIADLAGEATPAPLHGRALLTQYTLECPPFIWGEGVVRCKHADGEFHMFYLNTDTQTIEFTATGQEPVQGQRTVTTATTKTVTQNYLIWYGIANKGESCKVT